MTITTLDEAKNLLAAGGLLTADKSVNSQLIVMAAILIELTRIREAA